MTISFVRVPSPTEDEEKRITIKIARRVRRYLEKMDDLESDALAEKESLLAKCYAASIRSLSAIGNDDRTIMGFNLHAFRGYRSR